MQIARYFHLSYKSHYNELPAKSKEYNAAQNYQHHINALHRAAKEGDREYVAYILCKGIDPDATESHYYLTPLMKAAKYNHQHIITDLLEAGAHPNIRNKNGETALHGACRNCNRNIIERLIAYGAISNVSKHNNATPLWLAAQRGDLEIAKLLIKHGADINKQHTHRGVTPLFIAIDQDNIDISLHLIQQQSIDVNIATHRNRTPLMRAAERGQKTAITALLKKGADKNMVHETDNTALSFAQNNGHTDIATMLT
jgi:ankyrin repeat protein